MNRLLFFLTLFSFIISDTNAQYYSSGSHYYGAGYEPLTFTYGGQAMPSNYSAHERNYYSRGTEAPSLHSGGYPNWPYASMPPDESLIDRSKPIEIWLDKKVGRWGDYWFHALGGKETHRTPKGTFTVKSKYEDFYSRKYDSPMPRSVFFTEQCAIHVGSLKVKSHGCIHVDWPTGELIYKLASAGKTKVKVHP